MLRPGPSSRTPGIAASPRRNARDKIAAVYEDGGLKIHIPEPKGEPAKKAKKIAITKS